MIDHPTRVILAASLAGALALSACGQEPATNGNASTGGDPAGSDDQRYTATGTVLANEAHGPQLCGVVATSYPPQCGGLDIVGWDWGAVESQTQGDVQWGEYTVVGTWDGERLHLTEPPSPPQPPESSEPGEPADEVTTPCEEPEGGWQDVDPDKANPADQQRAISRARSASEFGGAWIDPLGQRDAVLNLSFTGDLAAKREWIREVWGGPLCVSKAERSYQRLEEVQREIVDVPGFISGGIDEPANVVRIEVYVATDELRAELTDRYGPGTVELTGFLQPVD
ncbi:MAG: hypothetical protein GEU97_13970 [Actinophytocola sp.]|nr:hypothetical protein [Actinophytocola sp.]